MSRSIGTPSLLLLAIPLLGACGSGAGMRMLDAQRGGSSAIDASFPVPTSRDTVAPIQLRDADSLTLERTGCFGSCPAYRLRVARAGDILFRSRNRNDTTRVESGRIDSATAATVFQYADMMRFAELPDRIATEPAYCPNRWTDNPTATTTIFVGGRSKRVEDYYGCWWAPEALRRLERLIDSVSGSSRWVRPNVVGRAPPA